MHHVVRVLHCGHCIAINLVKSLALTPVTLLKGVRMDDEDSLLAAFLPALTTGRKLANLWQSKAPSTSVFILQLKPTGYIYSGQTDLAAEEQGEKRCGPVF